MQLEGVQHIHVGLIVLRIVGVLGTELLIILHTAVMIPLTREMLGQCAQNMQIFDPQAFTLCLNEGFVPVFLQQITSIQLLRTDQLTGIAGFAADL
ncbi:hypothetical protein D3C75_1042160 [compost metagenome]